MSLMELHLVRVRCDDCGKLAGNIRDARPNAMLSRRRARELGFVRKMNTVPNRDLCPDCNINPE